VQASIAGAGGSAGGRGCGRVGWVLHAQAPASFYHSYRWTGEERSVVNQRAVDKLTQTRNFAAEAAARERQATAKGTTRPDEGKPMSVTFSEEELNAFLLHNFKDRMDDYVDDPGIFLGDGAIILAGQIKDSGYVSAFILSRRSTSRGSCICGWCEATAARCQCRNRCSIHNSIAFAMR